MLSIGSHEFPYGVLLRGATIHVSLNSFPVKTDFFVFQLVSPTAIFLSSSTDALRNKFQQSKEIILGEF